MSDRNGFLKLSRPALVKLATALETGRLAPPFSLSTIANYVPAALSPEIIDVLNRLSEEGVGDRHIAYTLRLLAAERVASQANAIPLSWYGLVLKSWVPKAAKKSVVVRELFSTAKHSVLISSFAIDRGEKARKLFQVLQERMDANPYLKVQMFLNIQRPHHNRQAESILLTDFANTFRRDIWSGTRLPEVFHDPRSLLLETESKACLHAKCVVVDEERLLVTSANFTEAAHERNIEAGVLLTDRVAARAMQSQFESLVAQGLLHRISGL